MFSRIRDHEEIAERGEDPVAVLKARKTGTFEDDDGNIIGGETNRANAAAAAAGRGDGSEDVMSDEMLLEGTYLFYIS